MAYRRKPKMEPEKGMMALHHGAFFAKRYADRIGPTKTPVGFAKTESMARKADPRIVSGFKQNARYKERATRNASRGSAKNVLTYTSAIVPKAKLIAASHAPRREAPSCRDKSVTSPAVAAVKGI